MIATLPPPKSHPAKAAKTPRRGKFWARKANSEPDRPGDGLLGNLAGLRAQAAARPLN